MNILTENKKSMNELAENAIGIILAGSEDWSTVKATDLDIEGEYEWQDDTCMLRFTANGKHIGFWDIDSADIEDVIILDDIASEVEAAVSGMEFDAINEGIEPTFDSADQEGPAKFLDADTYVFKTIDRSYWEGEYLDVKDFEGKKCKVIGTDIEGPDFESGYYTIEFEDGKTLSAVCGMHLSKVSAECKEPKTEGATKKYHNIGTVMDIGSTQYQVLDQNSEDTLLVALNKETGERRNRYIIAWGLQRDGSWNQGHYYTDEESARKAFDERARKTVESVEGFKAGRLMDRQPDSGTWLRLDYRDHTSYLAFGKESEDIKNAEFCYNAILHDFENGTAEGFPDLQCISLGFTCTNGRPSYRWQKWIDQIEKPLTESVAIGIEALKQFGYIREEKHSSNMAETYISDEWYCPTINIYEDGSVEIEPLSSDDDMPLTMTVAEHGKMVLKLAQIQKVLETL